MVVQFCEYTKKHWTVHIEWVVWCVNYSSIKLSEKKIILEKIPERPKGKICINFIKLNLYDDFSGLPISLHFD